ncbi:hypothetical protein GCM10017788_26570 [Amycolatopsis acidiphila]|nr:hypothetical protein GCM10017788_26570 [Amycolatopsis acidiphila]
MAGEARKRVHLVDDEPAVVGEEGVHPQQSQAVQRPEGTHGLVPEPGLDERVHRRGHVEHRRRVGVLGVVVEEGLAGEDLQRRADPQLTAGLLQDADVDLAAGHRGLDEHLPVAAPGFFERGGQPRPIVHPGHSLHQPGPVPGDESVAVQSGVCLQMHGRHQPGGDDRGEVVHRGHRDVDVRGDGLAQVRVVRVDRATAQCRLRGRDRAVAEPSALTTAITPAVVLAAHTAVLCAMAPRSIVASAITSCCTSPRVMPGRR